MVRSWIRGWTRAAAGFVVLVAGSAAPARITLNTIDSVIVATGNGRHVVVTGPLACDAGERVYLSVMVTQRTTGAVATARTFVVCKGEERQWGIDAVVIGNERFETGPAIAVAVARTITKGVATDAHQWLVPVALVEE